MFIWKTTFLVGAANVLLGRKIVQIITIPRFYIPLVFYIIIRYFVIINIFTKGIFHKTIFGTYTADLFNRFVIFIFISKDSGVTSFYQICMINLSVSLAMQGIVVGNYRIQVVIIHAVPLTISYHQFQLLTG